MKAKLYMLRVMRHSSCLLLVTLALLAIGVRAAAQSGWGYALSFDGTSDAVSASGITLTNTSMTIELWARRASAGTWDPFVWQGGPGPSNGLFFAFSYLDTVTFSYYGNELSTPQAYYADTGWHHWAATHERATGQRCIYRDGQVVATDTNWWSYTGEGVLSLGVLPYAAPDYFHGQLDEVRVWNVARTAAEIRQNLYGRLTGQELNLIAYWKFDQGSGTTAHDSSTNGHDGSLNGPQWALSTISPWGNALSFDGVNDYVRATIPPLASDYTVSAWVYLRAGGNVAAGGASVVGLLSATSCGASAEVMIRSQTSSSADPQYLELGRCNAFVGTASTREVPLNQWTHVAVSVSATKQVEYFINGLTAGCWDASGRDLTIGPNISLGDNTVRRFNGMLEDVRIWNKARTAAEIEADFARPLNGGESNLVAYWVFNEGAGATALDCTANGHDGTLVNGPLWTVSTVPCGTRPVAEITTPQCPVWADVGKPIDFVVTGIDPDNDLSYCDMGVDGAGVGQKHFSSTNTGATCTFTYSFLKPGTNFIWFQAFDRQHNPSPGARCTVQVIAPPFSTNLTVLTYNTHLFENSPLECIARCGGIWPQFNYEDDDRKWWIGAHVRSSGADIVALQEVWSYMFRNWFAYTLDEGFPLYQYNCWWVENTVNCKEGLRAYNSLLPAGIDVQSLPFLPEGDWERRFNTLGPGLVLLSKYPLSDLRFERFPTYYQNARPGDSEAWADKGVLTATVDVKGTPIRVGISHALTGAYDDWHFGSWDYDYLNKPMTAFQVGGEPYLLALRNDGQARISRFEDYRYTEEVAQTTKHGAGWKHIYTNFLGNYDCLTSFQSGGRSFILAQAGINTHIYRINEDPSTGWTLAPTIQMAFNPLIPFRLANHPYLLDMRGDSTAIIARINDDPATGWTPVYTNTWDSAGDCVLSFESGGEPYFFSFVGSDYAHARITKVNSDPTTGWTHLYTNSWDAAWNPNAANTKSFQLNGQGYLLGYNSQGEARFTRINTAPSTGWTHLSTNAGWGTGWVVPFEMKGHPYFFMPLACCGQTLDSTLARLQPWRASVRRINDGGQGWEELLQLEGIRMIRDATVVDRDGPPAIMMGDFNIHPDNYGVMNEIFKKVGAVDAYTKVHGTAAGGETIDWFQNQLMQYFWPTTNDLTLVSRIDYVYVKRDGNGLWLEPTDAYVRRDWTPVAGKDLSDHYPVLVEFRLQEEVRLEATAVAGGPWQLGITGTIGRLCELQYSSDLFTWDKLTEFRIAGSPHRFTDPTPVTTGARFYRLRLLP